MRFSLGSYLAGRFSDANHPVFKGFFGYFEQPRISSRLQGRKTPARKASR
jgi:hypothetical protein